MTKVSDKRLLEMYNALRPYRSSKQELLDIASELDGLGLRFVQTLYEKLQKTTNVVKAQR